MFTVIWMIVMIKMAIDLTDYEKGIMLYLTRIFVIPCGAILGCIAGIILDFIVYLAIMLVKGFAG